MRWRCFLKWTTTVLSDALALLMATADHDGCMHLAGDPYLGPAQLQADIAGQTLYIRQSAPNATLFPPGGSATRSTEPGFRIGKAEWLIPSSEPSTDVRIFVLPLAPIATTTVPAEHFWLGSYATCPAGWMLEVYLDPILAALITASIILWVPWRCKRPGLCVECGYSLAGICGGAPCPECGSKAPAEHSGSAALDDRAFSVH